MADFLTKQRGFEAGSNSWTVATKDLSDWNLSVRNPNSVTTATGFSPKVIIDEIVNLQSTGAQLLSKIDRTGKEASGGASDWGWGLLGELCEFDPPKSRVRELLADDPMVSFVPMNRLGLAGKVGNGTETRPLSTVYKSYTYFAEGDVLLAKITPCFENGKLGIAEGLEGGIGFGSSEFMVLRPGPMLLGAYLLYFLSQDVFRTAGQEVMTGAVGHRRVPREWVEKQRMLLPPLQEQQRLVSELDSVAEASRQLHDLYTRQLSALAELRQASLSLTLNGGRPVSPVAT